MSPQETTMDVLLFGIMRAGTTMLANLMTHPGHHIFIEPGITRKDMGKHIFHESRLLNWPVTEQEWYAVQDATERFEKFALPQIQNIRWGVKEVNPNGIRELIARYQPPKFILIIRDIRDIAASGLEKSIRQNTPHIDENWIADRCRHAAELLIALHREVPEKDRFLVRYENITQNSDNLRQLEQWLDWPLSGAPGQRMDFHKRTYEAERHNHTVSVSSVNRHAKQDMSERQQDFVARMRNELAFFQDYFGYSGNG